MFVHFFQAASLDSVFYSKLMRYYFSRRKFSIYITIKSKKTELFKLLLIRGPTVPQPKLMLLANGLINFPHYIQSAQASVLSFSLKDI